MAELSLAGIPPDLVEPGRNAAAALHAIAREEAAGRKPQRLLEPDQALLSIGASRVIGPMNGLQMKLRETGCDQVAGSRLPSGQTQNQAYDS